MVNITLIFFCEIGDRTYSAPLPQYNVSEPSMSRRSASKRNRIFLHTHDTDIQTLDKMFKLVILDIFSNLPGLYSLQDWVLSCHSVFKDRNCIFFFWNYFLLLLKSAIVFFSPVQRQRNQSVVLRNHTCVAFPTKYLS